MPQWIARLLGLEPEYEEPIPCRMFVDDNLIAKVFKFPVPTGDIGYRIEVEYMTGCEWLSIVDLRDYNVQRTIDLLQEAVEYLALHKGVRKLPAVRLWGKRYYLDERLKELRNIEDPDDRIELRVVN